jgi:hypothetical protein
MAIFAPVIPGDCLIKSPDFLAINVPSLQIFNIFLGCCMFSWELTMENMPKFSIYGSIELRLAVLPLLALFTALQYQGFNASLHYLIGFMEYFRAYYNNEVRSLLVSCPARPDNRIVLTIVRPSIGPQTSRVLLFEVDHETISAASAEAGEHAISYKMARLAVKELRRNKNFTTVIPDPNLACVISH